MSSIEKRDQFDIRTPNYLEQYAPFRDNQSLAEIAKAFNASVEGKSAPLVCLDAMAGTGIVGREMLKAFGSHIEKLISLDASRKMLDSDTYTSDDEQIHADISHTPLASGSIDLIFCRGGLNNVAESSYQKIFTEMFRIIAKEGKIILQDHFPETPEEQVILNELEQAIADEEGRSDATYVPTIDLLCEMVAASGGIVKTVSTFSIPLSIKERFAAKGIDGIDLAPIAAILQKQTSIKYVLENDDIIISYPIATVTIEKSAVSQDESVETINRERAWQFLESQEEGGFFTMLVAKDQAMSEIFKVAPQERFSALAIIDVLPLNPRHTKIVQDVIKAQEMSKDKTFHFFRDPSLLPADTDTTALASSLLFEHGVISTDEINGICDRILTHCDKQSRIQVYLTNERPRLDHVVAVNAMRCFYAMNREADIGGTEAWIGTVLSSREYLDGSRYYPSPDTFLYFLHRLIEQYPRAEQKFGALVSDAVRERIGTTTSPLDCAMRSIVGKARGVDVHSDLSQLKLQQQEDGSWPNCAFFLAQSMGYFGSQSVTTAFALRALSL